MPFPHRAFLLAALALVPVAARAAEPAPTPAKELALEKAQVRAPDDP